jgi:hypothetical protein
MKRRAKASLVLILSVLAILGVVGILVTSRGENEEQVASKFMSAVAKLDAKTANETSFIENVEPAESLKLWEKTFEYNRNYRFVWQLKGASNPTPGEALVKIGMRKDAASMSTYDENFDLRLAKDDKRGWIVDVNGLSRKMYPNLPR